MEILKIGAILLGKKREDVIESNEALNTAFGSTLVIEQGYGARDGFVRGMKRNQSDVINHLLNKLDIFSSLGFE